MSLIVSAPNYGLATVIPRKALQQIMFRRCVMHLMNNNNNEMVHNLQVHKQSMFQLLDLTELEMIDHFIVIVIFF